MTRATWKVIDRGEVPDDAPLVLFDCPKCAYEAWLPMVGVALAQLRGGIVFDGGDHAMPRVIQCRHCRRRFDME